MARPSVTCYVKSCKRKQRLISEAFAQGAGGRIAVDANALQPGAAAFYGVWENTIALRDRAKAEGRDWYYIDNAYFGIGDYYRVTRNAEQHDGLGARDGRRWHAHGLKIEPWRTGSDGHILVTTQSQGFFNVRGESRAQWLDAVLNMLRRNTERCIVVREKPKRPDDAGFYDALEGAWALVTRSSNTAVLAALKGVPVFCTHPCAALTMGSGDLTAIEAPRRPEGRQAWAECLAASQWTLDEIRRGVAWQALRNR